MAELLKNKIFIFYRKCFLNLTLDMFLNIVARNGHLSLNISISREMVIYSNKLIV